MAPTKPTTIRLNTEDKELLNKLAKKLGIKPSEVMRYAVRVLAEREGVRQDG